MINSNIWIGASGFGQVVCDFDKVMPGQFCGYSLATPPRGGQFPCFTLHYLADWQGAESLTIIYKLALEKIVHKSQVFGG